MSDSKIRLKIEVEIEGEVINEIVGLLHEVVQTLEQMIAERQPAQPSLLKPAPRFEDIPPAVNIAPMRRARP